MKEVACQFGNNKHLVGVLTVPEKVLKNKPAFIFVSAGLLNKTGPYRLYVLMARELARIGFITLRFDLGGIGDSSSNRTSGLSLHERNIEDVKLAMNMLTDEYATKEFVLSGLCSGAEDSFRVAVRDSRVKGLYLIDPHGFETAKSKMRHGLYRLQRKILNSLGWYTKRTIQANNNSQSESFDDIEFQYEMPREEARDKTLQLIAKNTVLKYVYTGGANEYFNYEEQFYDMYDGINKTELIEVEVLEKMGHMPLLLDDKKTLVTSISKWATKYFL